MISNQSSTSNNTGKYKVCPTTPTNTKWEYTLEYTTRPDSPPTSGASPNLSASDYTRYDRRSRVREPVSRVLAGIASAATPIPVHTTAAAAIP
jgi:hypothetical protein